MISNLCELFAQIDINGDGSMEWSELTSFIVEMGLQTQQHKPDGIQPYAFTSAEVLCKRNAQIGQIYHFATPDTLVTCELDASACTVYTSSFTKRFDLTRGEDAVVLGVGYLDSMGLYVVSTSDCTISLHDEHAGYLLRSFRTSTAQMCLEWVDEYRTLYTADRGGAIRAWDVVEMEEKHFVGGGGGGGGGAGGGHTGGHTDCVLAVLRLDGLDILASASMDRRVGLWDLATGRLRRMLSGHSKGVTSLAYSAEYRFLVSGGFDQSVIVWNP